MTTDSSSRGLEWSGVVTLMPDRDAPPSLFNEGRCGQFRQRHGYVATDRGGWDLDQQQSFRPAREFLADDRPDPARDS